MWHKQYYEAVGACVRSDSDFEELLRGCWQLSREAVDNAAVSTVTGSNGSASSSSSSSTLLTPATASVMVTLADGARRVEQVCDRFLQQKTSLCM